MILQSKHTNLRDATTKHDGRAIVTGYRVCGSIPVDESVRVEYKRFDPTPTECGDALLTRFIRQLCHSLSTIKVALYDARSRVEGHRHMVPAGGSTA